MTLRRPLPERYANFMLFRALFYVASFDQVLSGRIPSAKEDKEEGAIWAIGRWFTKFVDEAAAQNSGLMWIPSTNGFARSDSKQRPIEAYINKEEIACLCSFIGPQGVRCIDSMLLQVVAEKVQLIGPLLRVCCV